MKKWDLPKGWDWKVLSDVVQINMGQSPPGESYNLCSEGIPFLQGNAEFGELNPNNEKWTTSPTKKVSSGTILISVRAPVGDINIANKDYCIGRGLAGLTAKKCDPNFLYYYLKRIRPSIEDMGTGSTFKAISKTTIESIPIPVPPLETQQKIVAILDKAEEIKRLRDEANVQTQKLIQSVFLDMFGDPIINSKKWNMVTIDDVCLKITDGSHYTPKFVQHGYPFIMISDIKNNEIDFNRANKISQADYDKLKSNCNPIKGDVLFSKDGTIGKVIDITETREWIALSSLAIIRPNTNIVTTKYIKYLLGNEKIINQAQRKKTGTGLTRIILKNLKTLKIPIPPIYLQNQFDDYVKLIENSASSSLTLELEIEKLLSLLNICAFKGELIA